ncbi:hypothetical protein RclHR1_05890007 [Rhizophagus clarus]|uniref:Uncharacterized protein n=1 Tax=Rhizophagus clarus TaxID=94130 RepID=A0A2Z6RPM0_9GLOM|nr:hypothetical protein RclHR1_05890007 [Rhizophagus clarus]
MRVLTAHFITASYNHTKLDISTQSLGRLKMMPESKRRKVYTICEHLMGMVVCKLQTKFTSHTAKIHHSQRNLSF